MIRENALPWLDPESRCLLTLYILADRRCQAADIVRLVKMARKERIWRFRIGALRMPPPSRGSDRHWAAVIQLNYPREPNDLSVLRLAPGATAQDLVDALDAAAADQRAVILDTDGD